MNDLQIDYFMAVATNLSFTKTSEELYVSQPAISRQISQLEKELGTRLFRRNNQKTELTETGKLYFELNGETKLWERGTVFWHKAGEHTICETEPDDPYRCIVLHFKVGDDVRPGPRVSIWDSPDAAVEFGAECHQAFHSGSADLEALSAYAYAVLRWKASLRQASAEMVLPDPLKRALIYIQENFFRPIMPEDVSGHANLSRPYLFALFREHMKTTPCHYILMKRIGKAKLLLSGGLTPIKEIALLCGFESLEVFYRQFKKETSMTPADYRKKYSAYPELWDKLCTLQKHAEEQRR